MRLFVLLALAVLPVAGCSRDPARPEAARELSADEVTVARVSGGVRLTNGTDHPLAYAVWNRGWLALFAPCADPGPACVRLAPGASVTVPDAEIDGWAPGATEALVRWWRVLPDGAGGYVAGEVTERVVPL